MTGNAGILMIDKCIVDALESRAQFAIHFKRPTQVSTVDICNSVHISKASHPEGISSDLL
jgi:hypothetical protein